MSNLQVLEILTKLDLVEWRDLLDVLWGILDNLFKEFEGWEHPEVRIIAENTGEVMTYLNDAWWISRFDIDRKVRNLRDLSDEVTSEKVLPSRYQQLDEFCKNYNQDTIGDDHSIRGSIR